jgi:multiple sugar transport system substrate-binding protein
VLVGPALAGCTPPSDGRLEVRYWTGWTGPALEAQKNLVAEFNREHPRLRVRIISVGGSYDKVRIAFAGGATPDVISAVWAEELAGYAMRGALTPLDDRLKRSGRSGQEFMPGVWRMLQYHGHTWGLAVTTNTNLMVYNQEVFRESGLDPNQPPHSIAELDRDAAACTRVNPDGSFARYGFRPTDLVAWGYVFGGRWYDPVSGRVTANDPHNVAALRWMASYAKRYDISRMSSFESTFGAQGTPNGPFFVGKIAIWETGEWARVHIRRYAPALHWGYFPLPAPPGGRPRTTTNSGSVFVIPAACRHKQAAWEFLDWLTSPPAVREFCLAINNLPALRAVAAQPEWSRDPFMRFAIGLAGGDNAFGPPSMPVWPAYTDDLARAEDYALHAGADPQKLLDEVTVRMQRELDRATRHAVY